MKLTFATFLCFTIVNMVAASDVVIWQQELSCEPNSTCRPGIMVVNSISNEVVILGTSEQNMDTKKFSLWLWRIDPNGNVEDRKSLGLLSEYNSFMVGPFGIKATIKSDTGDIVRLKLDDANSMSLSVTNRNLQTSLVKLNTPARKLPGTLMLHDMISCQNDNLLLVGQDGKNGIVMKTDLAGNMVWEKIFDREQVDILSNIARDPEGIMLVAEIDGKIAGFVAGVTQRAWFYQ